MTKREFWLKLFAENDVALAGAVLLLNRFVTEEQFARGKERIEKMRTELYEEIPIEDVLEVFPDYQPPKGETMAEYIERDAIIAHLKRCTIISDDYYGMGIMSGIDAAMKAVVNAPTADVAPVVHGRWDEDHKCTHCGVEAVHHDIDDETVAYYPTRCCPNCGAKMDGEVHYG